MSRAVRPPNILFVVVDQLYAHQALPPSVSLPNRERLAARGVTFDSYQVTTTVCTPSRSTIYTGRHAPNTGMWDNTNLAWISDMSTEIPTVGHMLRDAGYHTAYKGKWHLSDQGLDGTKSALEPYGFSELQDWGETFGRPLDGVTRDPSIAAEASYWLTQRAPVVAEAQSWFLAVNFVNPHDIMYFHAGEGHSPGALPLFPAPEEVVYGARHAVELPASFDDDLAGQPAGVAEYRRYVEAVCGVIPSDRDDLWKSHINYYLNCIRDVDHHLGTVLDALEASGQADNTVIVFTSDHGEMAGAHGLRQKGTVAFREVVNVPFQVVHPDGPRGSTSAAVGCAVDLVPTLLSLAGVPRHELGERYPGVVGRDLSGVIADPVSAGPRGSAVEPGDGVLYTYDMLNSYDIEFLGRNRDAFRKLIDLGGGPKEEVDVRVVLAEMDEPDLTRRNLFRGVFDGRYKLVRYFAAQGYNMPRSVEELLTGNDVGLYDLETDPGELRNLARPDDPAHDPALLGRMSAKLNVLIEAEIGDDVSVLDRLPEEFRRE